MRSLETLSIPSIVGMSGSLPPTIAGGKWQNAEGMAKPGQVTKTYF